MIDFNEILNKKEYDFLRTNKNLKNKIVFLCVAGSYSYGTNIDSSDIDIRGVALDSLENILGISSSFEQFVDIETDTTIYSLSKFIKLVRECNPNIIEMLFCKPEHYFWVSEVGKLLLNNRKLFLTKKAYYTFGGYAHAQLNRLENVLVRDEAALTEEEKLKHINRSVTNANISFIEKFNMPEDAIKTYVGSFNNKPELLIDINLKGYPLSHLRSSIEEMTNVLRTFNTTIGQRNKKKDDLHLNKHMMHLIRLYLMCNEILRDGDLHTYREEHDLLMSIRNGYFREADGGVKKEFYDILNNLEKESEELYRKSSLPKMVNNELLEELMIKIIKEYIVK